MVVVGCRKAINMGRHSVEYKCVMLGYQNSQLGQHVISGTAYGYWYGDVNARKHDRKDGREDSGVI